MIPHVTQSLVRPHVKNRCGANTTSIPASKMPKLIRYLSHHRPHSGRVIWILNLLFVLCGICFCEGEGYVTTQKSSIPPDSQMEWVFVCPWPYYFVPKLVWLTYLASHLFNKNLCTKQQCPGRFSGIIGRDPSVSKLNWLHVDIFPVFIICLRYFL